jgi:hypothetical protein
MAQVELNTGTIIRPWTEDSWKSYIRATLEHKYMAAGRGLHSSTFRLNVSSFCGIRWLHDVSPTLLDRGKRGGVTKTA